MKNLRLVAAIIALTALPGQAANEALPSISGGAIVGYVVGGAGLAFTPTTDIYATSLGYVAAELGSYSGAPVRLNLWSSSGSILASTLVNTSSPLHNQSRYEPISSTLLSIGETYYLQAMSSTFDTWAGRVAGAGGGGSFTIAPEIEYIGPAFLTNGAGVFPASVTHDPTILYIGANFEFTAVPEPSIAVITILGVACLGIIVRKNRRP